MSILGFCAASFWYKSVILLCNLTTDQRQLPFWSVNHINILVGRKPQKYWVLLHNLAHVISLQFLTISLYAARLRRRPLLMDNFPRWQPIRTHFQEQRIPLISYRLAACVRSADHSHYALQCRRIFCPAKFPLLILPSHIVIIHPIFLAVKMSGGIFYPLRQVIGYTASQGSRSS